MKKFIVEFGMGTDFHGQDVTKAAKKAEKDAVSRSCLCGLDEVLGLTDFTRQVRILATVAVSRPEEVDCAEAVSYTHLDVYKRQVLYLAVSNFAQMQIQWFKVRTYFIGEFLI